jgi:hypothetical protein
MLEWAPNFIFLFYFLVFFILKQMEKSIAKKDTIPYDNSFKLAQYNNIILLINSDLYSLKFLE